MKASDVKVDTWMMVVRTHLWYRKVKDGSTYTSCTVIGDGLNHLIPNNEEVILEGQTVKDKDSKTEESK